MSFYPADDPKLGDPLSCNALEQVIVPRARDLGGFEVRRALPSAKRQMVGPFIFFDQMGPAEFLTDQGIDVRPHPHIGLATLTYLLEGEILHRDSVGTEMTIRPGAVNWMTAGQGIAHSERSPEEARRAKQRLFGLQTWIALPDEHEEDAPSFAHVERHELPTIEDDGACARLIAGSAWGETSPVKTYSDMVYADVSLKAGSMVPLDAGHEERAVYVLSGAVEIAGERFPEGQLLVFRPGDRIAIRATEPSRLMVVGGASMTSPRHIWWNFVSSRKERIEEAKDAWRAGRFDRVVNDAEEFIPLPDKPPANKATFVP